MAYSLKMSSALWKDAMKRKNLRDFRGIGWNCRLEAKKAGNFVLFLGRKMKEYFMNYEFLISKADF
jgi:hypothetical protein